MPAEYRVNEVCLYQMGKGARGDGGTLVDRIAWRLCNLNCWLIIDVRAGRGADAFENKALPTGRRFTADPSNTDDGRRTVEDQE